MIKNRFYFSLLAILLLAVSCSSTNKEATGPAEVVYARRASPYHVVKKDETVQSIASLYSMKENDLIRMNRLKEPYSLIVGQRLLVNLKNKDSDDSSDVSVKPLEDAPPPVEGQTGTEGAPGTNADGTKLPGTDTLTDAAEGALKPSVPNQGTAAAEEAGRTGATQTVNYEWPVKGDIVQNFGQTLPDGSVSEGINIKVPSNVPVKAAAEGTVKVVKPAGANPTAYGNMIVLKHPDGRMSIYAHLNEASVKTGDAVKKASVIGRSGKTGAVKEPQLYFQIRDKSLKPLDPVTVLP